MVVKLRYTYPPTHPAHSSRSRLDTRSPLQALACLIRFPCPSRLHTAPHVFAQPALHAAGAPGRICFPGAAQSEAVRGSAELVVLSLQAGQDGPVGAPSAGVQVPRNLLLSLG